MKSRLLILTILVLMAGCIKIENIPIVSVAPTVSITSNISNGKLNATLVLNPVTSFLVGGNVQLIYNYEGEATIIDAESGTILASTPIQRTGEIQVISISADTAGINDFIISAMGELKVNADGKGKPFLTSSPFYGESQFTVFVEEIPRLSLLPNILISSHISGGELKATVTINANPAIQNLGNIPIRYDYNDGEVSLIDAFSGVGKDNGRFESGEPIQVTSVSADTTGIDRFIITVSGYVYAYGETGSGDPSNDIELASARYYAETEVIINPE